MMDRVYDLLVVVTYITLCWACIGFFLRSMELYFLRKRLAALQRAYAELLGITAEEAHRRLTAMLQEEIDREMLSKRAP